jgi:hypothetical protein
MSRPPFQFRLKSIFLLTTLVATIITLFQVVIFARAFFGIGPQNKKEIHSEIHSGIPGNYTITTYWSDGTTTAREGRSK